MIALFTLKTLPKKDNIAYFKEVIDKNRVLVIIVDMRLFFTIPLGEGLTAREQSECDRIPVIAFRKRTIVHKSLRRLIIAQILGVPFQDISFKRGVYGKPALCREKTLCFNISHSENFCALALAKNEIGVDVEEPRTNINHFAAANMTFAEEELAILNSLGKPLSASYFLQTWTRKEAIAKLLGVGLNYDFRSLLVSNDAIKQRMPNLLLYDFSSSEFFGAVATSARIKL